MSEGSPKVIVDTREPETILGELRRLKVRVHEESLSVADYVVSNRIGIERKTGMDFVSSIIDGRLFEQLERLSSAYQAPVLVLEDFKSGFERDGMRPASIYGAMAFVTQNLRIPIVPTIDLLGSAIFISRLAYREQIDNRSPILTRKAPKEMTLRERQIFFLEGLERTGARVAERLLEEFRSPMEVFKAIERTQIILTKTGNPKGITGPLKTIKGLGHQFVNQNKRILTSNIKTEDPRKRVASLSSLLENQKEVE